MRKQPGVKGVLVTALLWGGVTHARAEGAFKPFEGEKSSWHDGFDRYDFAMDAKTLAIAPFRKPENEKFNVGNPAEGTRRCVVICPKVPAPGNPWSWQGCYWDHQPQTEVELLHRGFFVAYVSAGAGMGPDEHWDAWYRYLVEQHGLSARPAFVGMSRGGEFEFTWAGNHPDKVSAIYADNPGGNEEMMRHLGDLARSDVPVLMVCGSVDPLMQRFAGPIEALYPQFGGRVSMIVKEGAGHHPHSLRNAKPIADFIEQSVRETPAPPPPDFAEGKKYLAHWYYGLASTYGKSEENGYFLTRRGAIFTPCYRRYEINLGFEVPVNVIAPLREAPGRPWVYRATFVPRDAAVDQALLARGYHIVTGPIGYNNDGPVPANWDKTYAHLVAHGFAKKAVMEGEGGGAGAIYAWAADNPDKVACIYAENPMMHCAGVKVQPVDRLQGLAQAHVPVLQVLGADDPSLDEAHAAKQRYKELGGPITTIVLPGEGHALSPARDVKVAIDFITAH